MGTPQGNTAFRKLTVFDGDNYSGERCELGYNTWNDGLASPTDPYGIFSNYFEGVRRATYFSVKLPDNFPLERNQPAGPSNWHDTFYNYTGGDATSHLPLRHNIWTRIAVDAFYSQNPSLGWIKVYVDANGDGGLRGLPGEQSPVVHGQTLLRQLTAGCSSSPCLSVGDSIPDHLRAGIYHDSAISCPKPSPGCSDQIDNVQVLGP